MMASLKFGHTTLSEIVFSSYSSAINVIKNFFLHSNNYKEKYKHLDHYELGYRFFQNKEMFLLRHHEVPTEFTPCLQMAAELHNLAVNCLKQISNELQLEPGLLLNLIDKEPIPSSGIGSSVLRFINYHKDNNALQHATDIHQDLGLLTLICYTGVPALEIYDFLNDTGWIDIEALQKIDDVIVMAGESLSLISNNYYLAATHRVRSVETTRLAISYQLRFRPDAILDSQQFETPVTGNFSKPFCMTASEVLQSQMNLRTSVNGSY